ncbi:hypothetical protein GCM10010532_064820 [Dactylosporangium siamense]
MAGGCMRRSGSEGDTGGAERDAWLAARQSAVGAQGPLGGAAECARHRLGTSRAAVAGGRLDVDGHGVVRGRDLVRDDPVSNGPVRSDLVSDGPVRGNPVPGNPVRRDPLRGNPVGPGLFSDASVRGDPVGRDPLRGNPVRLGLISDAPVSNDLVPGNPVRRDPLRGNPVRLGLISDAPVRGDPVGRDPVSDVLVRGNPARCDPVSDNLVRGDPVGPGPVSDAPVSNDRVRGNPVRRDPFRGDLGGAQRAHAGRHSRGVIRVAWAGFGRHRRPPRGIEKRGRAPGVTKASWLGERPPVHPTARTPQYDTRSGVRALRRSVTTYAQPCRTQCDSASARLH